MPQAIAYAAYSFVSFAGSIGVSSAAAVAVLDTAIKVALLTAVNAAVQQNNEPEVQGGMVNLTINATEPRRLQIGQRVNGGVLVDWYVRGSKNQNLYMVIYLGEGPQGALTRVTAGGRDVYTSTINHGVRTTIPDFRSGGDRLWITYYDGRPGQTADANLVSQGLGWTSACIGEGCAYVIVECQWDEDNLTSPPSLGFETEGAKLYDRRLDTTAGGSGSHRLNDPATWALSVNPAVAADHYMLGRLTSNGTLAMGIGLDPADVPYDRFEALANLCDESVTLSGTGSHARYAANGFLFADRAHDDTIKDLCRAMNARPADFGGRVGILDGEAKTAVLTLTDEDVFDASAEQYRPKRAWGDLINEVRGTYISPTQNYQAVDFPRVTNAAWKTADGGETREATLNLEMEVNAERAQRLAWLHAKRERRQAQLSGVYSLRAIELEQGDWFVRSGGIFGAGKTFEVINRSLNTEDFTVTITAFEVDASDTAWTTDIPSDPPPDGTPDASSLAAMEVPAITVTGLTLSGTESEIPAIKVAWTAPTDPAVRQILIEYAPTGGDVSSTLIDAAAGSAVFTNGITDDTDYLVHARFIGAGIPSDWTGNVAVTTSGTYSVGVALSFVGQQWGATATEGEASNAIAAAWQYSENFTRGGVHFTNDFGGSPDAVADPGGSYTDTSEGRALHFSALPKYLTHKAFFKPKPGGRYLCVARVRMTTDVSGGTAKIGHLSINGLSSTFVHGGSSATGSDGAAGFPYVKNPIAVADGWQTVARVWTAAASLSTYDAYWRPRLDFVRNSGTGGEAECVYFQIFDVTDIPVGRSLVDLLREDGLTPVDEADLVTSEGVAAAILGQGWGATASESDAGNGYVPTGQNAVPNSEFAYGSGFPPAGWVAAWNGTTTGGVTRTLETIDTNRRALKAVAGGTPSSGQLFDIAGISSTTPRETLLAVLPGERVGASALVAHNTSASKIGVTIVFRTAANAYLSETRFEVVNAKASISTVADFVLAAGTAIAPAGTAWASLTVRVFCAGGAAPAGYFMEPVLCRLPAGQTVVPPYAPTTADRMADPTEDNVASSVTGQQNGATTSFYYQGTDPGGSNGDWWADTSALQLKIKIAGTWTVVSNFTAGAGAMSISVSGTFSKTRFGSGTVTWTDIFASASGGTGPYTYHWEKISGTDQSMTGGETSAPDFTSPFLGVGAFTEAVYQVSAYDTATGEVAFKRIYLYGEADVA